MYFALKGERCFLLYIRRWCSVSDSKLSVSQLVQVLKIIIHHQYNTRTKDCDLALVKLERPLIFNQFVRPIDLWMTPLPEHMKCTITGWGSTHESEDCLRSRTRTSRVRVHKTLFFQMVLGSTGCRR